MTTKVMAAALILNHEKSGRLSFCRIVNLKVPIIIGSVKIIYKSIFVVMA